MGLIEEIDADYTDRDGLVTPQKCLKTSFSTTGNGLSYTAMYCILLARINGNIIRDRDIICAAAKCNAGNTAGIYNRSPEKLNDQNGMDDYTCMAAASPTLATYMLGYATNHEWLFNNVSPGKFTWSAYFGRSPAFRAHLYFATNRIPFILWRIGWMFQIAFASVSDATSVVLTDLMVDTMAGKSAICTLGAAVWARRSRHRDRKEVMIQWLNNKDHPIVKYWV